MPQFVVVGVIGTPKPFATAAAPKYARSMTVVAQRDTDALAGAPNSGNVAIGHEPAVDKQPLLMAPGVERVFNAPANVGINLSTWFLSVLTNGDSVVVIYD